MNEKKFILTEQQLEEALRIAAMGEAGLLHPSEITSTREKLPEEIAKLALASALAAGCIRTEGQRLILGSGSWCNRNKTYYQIHNVVMLVQIQHSQQSFAKLSMTGWRNKVTV